MLKIALLDDKSYGIKQIEEIHSTDDFDLTYFDTYKSFIDSKETFDIVYLDYFLDKDNLTGIDVLDEVKKRAKHVVGFSSVQRYSKLLQEKGADDWTVKK